MKKLNLIVFILFGFSSFAQDLKNNLSDFEAKGNIKTIEQKTYVFDGDKVGKLNNESLTRIPGKEIFHFSRSGKLLMRESNSSKIIYEYYSKDQLISIDKKSLDEIIDEKTIINYDEQGKILNTQKGFVNPKKEGIDITDQFDYSYSNNDKTIKIDYYYVNEDGSKELTETTTNELNNEGQLIRKTTLKNGRENIVEYDFLSPFKTKITNGDSDYTIERNDKGHIINNSSSITEFKYTYDNKDNWTEYQNIYTDIYNSGKYNRITVITRIITYY